MPANEVFLSLAYDLTKVTWLYEKSSPFATYKVSQGTLSTYVNMVYSEQNLRCRYVYVKQLTNNHIEVIHGENGKKSRIH